MSYKSKARLGGSHNELGPSHSAHFLDEEARDRFVRAVGSPVDDGWSAEPIPGDHRGAWVRWRLGRFLGLNDIAYSHGGRIAVSEAQRAT